MPNPDASGSRKTGKIFAQALTLRKGIPPATITGNASMESRPVAVQTIAEEETWVAAEHIRARPLAPRGKIAGGIEQKVRTRLRTVIIPQVAEEEHPVIG